MKGVAMWWFLMPRRFSGLAFICSFFLLASSPGAANAATAWRSGHQPTIISAEFDNQRRLTVLFNALDGVTYGGFVLIDNDPANAKPAAVTSYGPIMPCNNKGTCMGSWPMPANAESNTYTFTTEPLSEQKFPAATYYLQLDTWNEDPYPSTRQEEFSEIRIVVLSSSPSPVPHKVPLLTPMKLPVNNGTPLCNAWRDQLVLGNQVVQALNDRNKRMNTALAKMTTFAPTVEAIYQRSLKETSNIKSALEKNLDRVNSACGDAPSVVAQDGEFVPIPVPTGNGSTPCKKSRDHIVYINQELSKIVQNIRTTKLTQTTRIKQLNTRFNQLIADLKKSWPVLFRACYPS